jgi:NAD-dependent dihydropyrimidine dehydrogenase PreA subunit
MPFIITDPCIETKDTACVDVCPVDCIHPRKDEAEFAEATMLYIHPEECIDCGASRRRGRDGEGRSSREGPRRGARRHHGRASRRASGRARAFLSSQPSALGFQLFNRSQLSS